jgi:hypothetical protein
LLGLGHFYFALTQRHNAEHIDHKATQQVDESNGCLFKHLRNCPYLICDLGFRGKFLSRASTNFGLISD